jgi:hypothetical protein
MKKRWALMVAVFILTAAFLAVFATVRETSPLRVGSAPDDAWTYIHTSAAWGGTTPNIIGVSQSHKWTADGGNIFRETEFRWRSGSPFAIRKTTFYFGTNATIRHVSASWKYEWPFAKKKVVVVPTPYFGGGFGTNTFYPADPRIQQLMNEARQTMSTPPRPDSPAK